MLGRVAAAAALIALAGCAGMESAGRNARTGEPTRVAATPAPPPPEARTTPALPPPAQTAAPAPVVAAPLVTAPPPSQAAPPPPQQSVQTPPPAPVQRADTPPPPPEQQVAAVQDRPVAAGRTSEEVIVPGQLERQVPAPNGDPRSTSERMQDIRAWDQCVMRVQDVFDADPMSAQLEAPEEYCARSLGMANRTSVPESRRERRR